MQALYGLCSDCLERSVEMRLPVSSWIEARACLPTGLQGETPHLPWMSSVSRKRCRPNTSLKGCRARPVAVTLGVPANLPTRVPALFSALLISVESRPYCRGGACVRLSSLILRWIGPREAAADASNAAHTIKAGLT